MEAEVRSQNMISQKPILLCLFNGNIQAFYRNRVFCTNVNIALPCPHCITGNGHCLNHTVRITPQHRAIHKCTRITFISVAADIFEISHCIGRKLPLEARREACSATSSKAGCLYLINNLLRCHLCEYFRQCHIAIRTNILINILRINYATVPQCNSLLLLVKGSAIQ